MQLKMQINNPPTYILPEMYMCHISHPRWSNVRGRCLEAVVSPSLKKTQNWTKQGSVHSPTKSAQEVGLGDLWKFLPNSYSLIPHAVQIMYIKLILSVSRSRGINYLSYVNDKKNRGHIFFRKRYHILKILPLYMTFSLKFKVPKA